MFVVLLSPSYLSVPDFNKWPTLPFPQELTIRVNLNSSVKHLTGSLRASPALVIP